VCHDNPDNPLNTLIGGIKQESTGFLCMLGHSAQPIWHSEAEFRVPLRRTALESSPVIDLWENEIRLWLLIDSCAFTGALPMNEPQEVQEPIEQFLNFFFLIYNPSWLIIFPLGAPDEVIFFVQSSGDSASQSESHNFFFCFLL
jgi:hypothetical protein